MAVRSRAKDFQRTIVIFSALGILVVGLIVATASILPLHDHLMRVQEGHLFLALRTKTATIEEYLSRAGKVASLIASRPGGREKLEDYQNGRASLEELVEYTRYVLTDAMHYSQDVWGISRLDRTGNVVVQVGLGLPASARSTIDLSSAEPSLFGPVTLGRHPYFVVVEPLLDTTGSRVGTDLDLFRLFALDQTVTGQADMGKQGETVLGVIHEDSVSQLFPFKDLKDTSLKTVPKVSWIGLAVKKAASGKAGMMLPGEDYTGNAVMAYGPIKGCNWGLVVAMDKDRLYAPVYPHLVSTGAVILGLIFLGTIGTVLLVRPLTGKMVIHADELERKVQEKTASLQKELDERKRMEQWLRDSERRYRILVEELPDIIFLLDDQGRFAYVNTQAEKFLKYPLEHILETPLKDHIAAGDRERIAALFKLTPESIWDEEVGVLDAEGATQYARIRCKLSYYDESGSPRYEGIMRDITRRRRLEEELAASRAELLEKMKIIDDLYEHVIQSYKSRAIANHTAEVAHELRQPLAIIGGFARRMARKLDSAVAISTTEQRESCRVMISEIRRLEKILDTLIDFTKRGSLNLKHADPNDIIESVLLVYEPTIQEKGIKLETNLGREVGEILIDANRFEQVVRNLISNAIEASSSGQMMSVETGVSIPSDKAYETGGLKSETYFEMKIRNGGQVIPSERLDKIFSPFFTTKAYGSGIGLTISKKIVEDHGGSISAKSDEEGTVFTVWLPIQQTGPLEEESATLCGGEGT
jgi:PAS domain S-box-containing protein